MFVFMYQLQWTICNILDDYIEKNFEAVSKPWGKNNCDQLVIPATDRTCVKCLPSVMKMLHKDVFMNITMLNNQNYHLEAIPSASYTLWLCCYINHPGPVFLAPLKLQNVRHSFTVDWHHIHLGVHAFILFMILSFTACADHVCVRHLYSSLLLLASDLYAHSSTLSLILPLSACVWVCFPSQGHGSFP